MQNIPKLVSFIYDFDMFLLKTCNLTKYAVTTKCTYTMELYYIIVPIIQKVAIFVAILDNNIMTLDDCIHILLCILDNDIYYVHSYVKKKTFSA
jgi:hypothetical protein